MLRQLTAGGTSRDVGLLSAILAAALGVRLLGVAQGLPYIHDWDEPHTLTHVIGMLQHGDLNPRIFVYPSVYYYMLLPVTYLHYWYLHAHGVLSSPWAIQLVHPQLPAYWWYISPPSFYLWGRTLTALVGTATVYFVYRIGDAVYSPAAGLLAAALLALAPGAVYYSDSVRVDIPVTFFVTLAVLAGLGIIRYGRRQDYLVAGLLAGLAISTKYPAFIVVGALTVAHVLNRRRARLLDRHLAAMAVWVVAGIIVGTPYAIINPQEFISQARWQALAVGGFPSLTWMQRGLPGYLGYFARSIKDDEWFVIPHAGMGMLPAVAALAGAVVGFRRDWRLHVCLLSFTLPYLLFMATLNAITVRFMLPLLPFAALFAADACIWAWQQFAARWSFPQPSWTRGLAVVMLVVLLAPPGRDAVALGRTFGHRPDTRAAAVEWLQRHVPADARVGFAEDLLWFLPSVQRLSFTALFVPQGATLGWYLQHHVDYAVVGSQNPLRALPVVATFPWPATLYGQDEPRVRGGRPLIDPTVYIVRPRVPEATATFPAKATAEDLIPEPVVSRVPGVFTETVHLPDRQFEPGRYTITVTDVWPWTRASSSSALKVQVLVGGRVVGMVTAGSDRPLRFTTPPFRIDRPATRSVQLEVALRTARRSPASWWAFRPAAAGCAVVADAPSLNPQHMTAEAWVYLEDIPAPAQIYLEPDSPNTRVRLRPESVAMILNKKAPAGYGLGLSAGSPDTVWVDFLVAGRLGRGGFTSVKKWTHIAATFSGDSIRVYLNGAPAPWEDTGLRAHYHGIGIIRSQGAPLFIGCGDPRTPGGMLAGLIARARIWNRVLSAADIRDEAGLRPLPANSPGLVGSWSLQTMTGRVVADRSPAHNDILNGPSLLRVPIDTGTSVLPAWTSGGLDLIHSVTLNRVSP